MDWSGQRIFGMFAGGILGALLGGIILSRGASMTGLLVLVLAVVVTNLIVTQRLLDRIIQLTVHRSQLMAAGQIPGEPAPARVHRVYGRSAAQSATMQGPGSLDPSRLAVLHVLPAHSAPRSVYAVLPERYGIQRGDAAAVVLDPANPDIAVLDDRVSRETLGAIGADPRWSTERVPSFFERQGGRATILASVIGLVGALLLGAVLR